MQGIIAVFFFFINTITITITITIIIIIIIIITTTSRLQVPQVACVTRQPTASPSCSVV